MNTMRTAYAICSAVLLALGVAGVVLELIFRMDPGDELATLGIDIVVGLVVGAGYFLHVLAKGTAQTGQSRSVVAAVPGAVAVIVVPALLFWWRKATLEARRSVGEQRESMEQKGEGDVATRAPEPRLLSSSNEHSNGGM